MSLSIPDAVISDIDLFADDVLNSPYAAYQTLRDVGPAAWLARHDVWFIGRFEQARDALQNWETFSSARGIGLNPQINAAWADALICVDPPRHTEMRKLITDRLGPRQLKPVEETIERRCQKIVELLVAREQFDAVADLARDLPVHVIMDLIGWPDDVRDELLELADGSFDPCGPWDKPRTQNAFPNLERIYHLVSGIYDSGTLTPGGFGSTVADAAGRGEITRETAIGMLLGYVVAAFDTTISAVASGIWLFAGNPDQWELLRSDPSLVATAFNEIVRMESPIQHFSRVTTRDVDMGEGVVIPADARVIVSYGCANRDERRFDDPDRFDITRKGVGHLGFGMGNHACAGQSLARLEGHSIFKTLAQQVARFELVGEPERRLYNVTRSFSRVPVRALA
ncbi:MAG: cytochrome P450 [Gammaproteobacteria bacterium]|nr:cytochrome P450 [Gammaproteobacteria bacterium]